MKSKAKARKAKQCNEMQSKVQQCKAMQNIAKKCKAMHCKAMQNKAKQRKAKQCEAKQRKAKKVPKVPFINKRNYLIGVAPGSFIFMYIYIYIHMYISKEIYMYAYISFVDNTNNVFVRAMFKHVAIDASPVPIMHVQYLEGINQRHQFDHHLSPFDKSDNTWKRVNDIQREAATSLGVYGHKGYNE